MLGRSIVICSLIEDKVSKGDTDWLKIFDINEVKFNTQKRYSKLLDSAYQLALPLEFSFVGKSLVRIHLLQYLVKEQYMRTFNIIKYYKLDSLIYNNQKSSNFNVCQNHLFMNYLNYHFKGLRFNALNIGCEARAGMISNYLDVMSQLKHYKIFFRGRLKLETNSAHYTWANHVLNLIPIKKNKRLVNYVFDPFILGGMFELDTFIKRLENSGSCCFEFKITDPNVFVCLMHQPIGIIDRQRYFSKMIFQKLYAH